jgi:hypothetical protein
VKVFRGLRHLLTILPVLGRTHDKGLGASGFFNDQNFKLVDQGTGQVLAVYRHNNGIFRKGRMAEIDYYVELGQQLELISMAAILGIELQVEQKKRNSAAASGGGGG